MQIHDHCFVVVTLLKALSCSGFINYKLIGPDIFTLIIDIFFLLLAMVALNYICICISKLLEVVINPNSIL